MIFVHLIEIKNACLKKKADKIFSTFKCVSVSIYRWHTVNSNLSIQISSSAFNCEFICSKLGNFSRLADIVAFVIYRTSSNVTLSTITTSTFDYSCMLFVFKFCISIPFISLIMNSGPRRLLFASLELTLIFSSWLWCVIMYAHHILWLPWV